VTDANLMLGRLTADRDLAGGLTLHQDLAARAIGGFGQTLGLGLEAAASGIVRIANSNMARGIRVMTVERGLDPRAFTLVAFGGAGPLHAVDIAVELEVPEVVIPQHPGVTSAQGLIFGDVVHDYAVSLVRPMRALDLDEVEAAFELLEDRGRAALTEDGFDAPGQTLERLLDVRYLGQAKALSIGLEDATLTESTIQELTRRFYDEYQRQYQYVTHDIPLELAVLRVRAIGKLVRPTISKTLTQETGVGRSSRQVFFDGERLETLVVERGSLTDRDRINGPALIEQLDTTTVIPPACVATVDGSGNLIIDVTQRIRQAPEVGG